MGAWVIVIILSFRPFAAILMWCRGLWTLTLLTAIGSRLGSILFCCVSCCDSCVSLPWKSCCCIPLKSVGGLRTTVMAPYRAKNKEPLSMAQMTSGKEGAMEQGSGSETTMEGYAVTEGSMVVEWSTAPNNERYV